MSAKYIRSTTFSDCYLHMNATGVTSQLPAGGGLISCTSYGVPSGNFNFVNLTGQFNGRVAIQSTADTNVYLRMDATNKIVNCQYSLSSWETFYLRDQGNGKVAIESAHFPQNYISINGGFQMNPDEGFGKVTVAASIGPWEVLELVDQPAKLTADEIRSLISKYGPQLRLHPDEMYLPTSVEWLLDNSTLRQKSGMPWPHPTPSRLPQKYTTQGAYWLDISQIGILGSLGRAKAYVHAISMGTATDIQFWFCYGYNGHAKVRVALEGYQEFDLPVPPLGEHFGDWECAMFRFDNVKKNMIGAWLSQHSGGQMIDKFEVAQWPTVGNQPIIYSSQNGHAIYPSVGNHFVPYLEKDLRLTDFTVRGYNICRDGGQILDCSKNYELVDVPWLPEIQRAVWLNYPYRWGPTGGSPYNLDPLINAFYAALPDTVQSFSGSREFCASAIRTIQEKIYDDNLDGPEGPALKDQWNGLYT